MKLLIAFSLGIGLLATPSFCETRKQPAAKTVKALEIPSAASAATDGTFHFTDAQGKKWIYYKTPFGVSRAEDKPADRTSKTDDFTDVKATAAGDTIHFERPGPFGMYRWDRKTSELNDMEQAVWNREKARAASRQE